MISEPASRLTLGERVCSVVGFTQEAGSGAKGTSLVKKIATRLREAQLASCTENTGQENTVREKVVRVNVVQRKIASEKVVQEILDREVL